MSGSPWVLAFAVTAACAAVALWPPRFGGSPRALAGRPTVLGRRARSLRRRVRARWDGRAGLVRRRQERSLLAVVDALGPALEAGLPPARALSHAAGSAADPVLRTLLRDAADAAAAGHPVGEALTAALADASGMDPSLLDGSLELLARAWRLADELGTPLADATTTVGVVVRADLAARRATEAAVAEAKASVRVLLLLPLVGPALALVVGASFDELYGSTLAAGCGTAGLALAAAGRAWMTRLSDGVAASADGP